MVNVCQEPGVAMEMPIKVFVRQLPQPVAMFAQQNCRLSVELLERLNGNLMSFVKVSDNCRESICKVKVMDTCINENDYLEYHSMVYKCSAETSAANKVHNLELLHTTTAAIVKICVVCNVENIRTFRNKLKTNRRSVEEMCLTLLYKFCIMKNFVVDFQFSELAKLYNISHIIIKSCCGFNSNENHNAFIINTGTEISICDVQSTERFKSRSSFVSPTLGGLEDIAGELVELLTIPFKLNNCCINKAVNSSCGILLRGPPGCGKTSLVKYVACKAGAHLVVINGPEVFDSRPGQTEENLRKIFEKAVLFAEEGPCVLFIDEIDTLCPKKKAGESFPEHRAATLVQNFLDSLSTHHLIVIGATNRPAFLDPSMRRPGRLDREIMLNVPSYQQRLAILIVHTTKLPNTNGLDLEKLAEITNGYVGADLASLCHEAVYLAMSDCIKKSQGEDAEIHPVTMEHFLHAAKFITPSMQKGAEGLLDTPPVSWEDIGGLEHTKLAIKQAVEWPIRHPEAFSRMGLPCPKGVLLHGPPGCCKTTLVRAAAASSKATFLSLSGAQLYSPNVGDSERIVKEVFQRARAGAPSILFLDEIDSIIGKRSDSSNQRSVQERVLSALLNEMDGIGIQLDEAVVGRDKMLEEVTCSGMFGGQGKTSDRPIGNNCSFMESSKPKQVDRPGNVIVVAATNRRDLLDEALVRPGRIDRILYVPPPDTPAQLQILKIYTKHMPLRDVNLDKIAMATENYTGADLENLCREAALKALNVDLNASYVEMDHFQSALCVVKPSLTADTTKKPKVPSKRTFSPKQY